MLELYCCFNECLKNAFSGAFVLFCAMHYSNTLQKLSNEIVRKRAEHGSGSFRSGNNHIQDKPEYPFGYSDY